MAVLVLLGRSPSPVIKASTYTSSVTVDHILRYYTINKSTADSNHQATSRKLTGTSTPIPSSGTHIMGVSTLYIYSPYFHLYVL